LRIIEQREMVFKNCDWAGGYLYKNWGLINELQ
jgi:hypothetical protein